MYPNVANAASTQSEQSTDDNLEKIITPEAETQTTDLPSQAVNQPEIMESDTWERLTTLILVILFTKFIINKFSAYLFDSNIRHKRKQVVVRVYRGNEISIPRQFEIDAIKMEKYSYYPTSQSWSAGNWGFGLFIIALLLCYIWIGLGVITLLYLLIIKPNGQLNVIYELRLNPQKEPNKGKKCPKCAEKANLKAIVCRYCGHEFAKTVYNKENFSQFRRQRIYRYYKKKPTAKNQPAKRLYVNHNG